LPVVDIWYIFGLEETMLFTKCILKEKEPSVGKNSRGDI